MVRGGHGRPPLGATPMILLVLYLLLLGSLSNCVPWRKEPELEPLPAGVDPYMQPAGILQPQIHPPGQESGSKPGAYGGTGSGSHAHPGPGSYGIDGPGPYRGTGSGSSEGALSGPYGQLEPGSYGIDASGASGGTWSGSSGGTWSGSSGGALPGPYGQPEPGSYGIDGPGASGGTGDGTFGGTGTGSSRGTGCMLNQGASGGSYLQPRPRLNGPGVYAGSWPVVSVGDYPVQAGGPGAGSGMVVARPFERVAPVYKRPGLPFVPGFRDNARLAGHVRVRYEDAGSPRGNSQPGLMAGKILRPKYKEPSIPYIPSHAELPCHAGQRVTSKPQVSTEGSGGGEGGGGEGAVTQEVPGQGSSTPMLSSEPASTGRVVRAGEV